MKNGPVTEMAQMHELRGENRPPDIEEKKSKFLSFRLVASKT